MRTENYFETGYPRTCDVLREEPALYGQVIRGLVGVIAGLAGFMMLVL